jgi:hypothetical protein
MPYPQASGSIMGAQENQQIQNTTALQRLLGHDRLATMEIYLNLSPGEVLREFQQKG